MQKLQLCSSLTVDSNKTGRAKLVLQENETGNQGHKSLREALAEKYVKIQEALGLHRWGSQHGYDRSFLNFNRHPVTLPKSRDTLRTAQLQVGMGFYSQCTAVLVSAHQQQALLVPKKLSFFF